MTPPNVIAIIPARGGSKGIPRKNVRFLAGRPLIHYAIEAALKAPLISEVIVSTDSDEIRYVSELAGARVMMRPEALAEDHVTLDPVIHHAIEQVEQEYGERFDVVVTVQPTSPLLSEATLSEALTRFLSDPEVDTMISVMDDRHLCWTTEGERFVPAYQARVNRQQLPANFRETGAFFITDRASVTPQSRMGSRVSVFEVPSREAVDIDSPTDWWVAEKLLQRRRVLMRVDGHNEIGLGHISRTLLLAHRLIDHELLFVSDERCELGVQILRESHFPLQTFSEPEAYERILDSYRPHLVINDILDTSPEQVELSVKRGAFTVNFEDLGEGAERAQLVINALYEEPLPRPNTRWSKDYFCLRDEFLLLKPRPVEPELKELLITFGGTDPNDFTRRVLRLLESYERPLKLTVILGRGYLHREALVQELKERAESKHELTLLHDVKNISQHMHRADLVFTSAGRTVYEVSSLGTPLIVLAQNERELLHTFARYESGVVNLGLGARCSDEQIMKTLRRLADDPSLRAELQSRLISHDLKGGVERTVELILSQYQAWESARGEGALKP